MRIWTVKNIGTISWGDFNGAVVIAQNELRAERLLERLLRTKVLKYYGKNQKIELEVVEISATEEKILLFDFTGE